MVSFSLQHRFVTYHYHKHVQIRIYMAYVHIICQHLTCASCDFQQNELSIKYSHKLIS